MVTQGQTFRLSNSQINNHLHIILSDPKLNPEKIVTVNFTSRRPDKDQSCLVEVGEHPFLTKPSCINYDNRLITEEQWKQCLTACSLILNEPLSPSLLKRILQGAAISPYLPLGNHQILVEQGLIDGD